MSRLRTLLLLALLAVPAALIAADALERYEVDRVQAENSVLASVRGWWDAPDVSPVLRALPAEQRAEAVRAFGGFVKAYVQSPEFKKVYAKAYKETQPKRGFGLPKLDVKAIAGKAVEKATGGGEAKKQGLDKDPNVTIKARLQEFLDATADIDYDAKTTGENRRGQFVNSDYEAKPPLWKMGFRAGREATEAARGFAKEWLAELP